MVDYTDRDKVEKLLTDAQDAEKDRREKVREVDYFLTAPDGQYNDEERTRMSGRP